MRRTLHHGLFLLLLFLLAFLNPSIRAQQKAPAADKQGKFALPPAVVKAIQAHRPGAVIDKMSVEKEAGITFYDFEFKDNQGEMDVAEDGTILDIASVITPGELPRAVAEAFEKAAAGAEIVRLEKSEVRAEIRKSGEKGRLVILPVPRYVFEAEFRKGNRRGEMAVSPDGSIVEPLKWSSTSAAKP